MNKRFSLLYVVLVVFIFIYITQQDRKMSIDKCIKHHITQIESKPKINMISEMRIGDTDNEKEIEF